MPGRSEVHRGAAAPAPLPPCCDVPAPDILVCVSAFLSLSEPHTDGTRNACRAGLRLCGHAWLPPRVRCSTHAPRDPTPAPKPPPATRGLHSVGQLSWSRQSSRWLSGQSAGGRAGWMASAGKPALPRAVTTPRHAVTPSGTRSPPSGTRSPPPGMRSWLVRPGGGERALSEGGSTYGPSKPPLGVDTASHLPHSVGQNKS